MKTTKKEIIEHKSVDIFDPSWVEYDESLKTEDYIIYDVDRFLERTNDIELDIDMDYGDDTINIALNCIVCGSELEGRIDKKFCSHKCAVKMKRTIEKNGILDPVSHNELLKKDNETVAQHIKRLKKYI